MYYLNIKLIERLPRLLKVGKGFLCDRMGVDSRQYSRWASGGYMSADMLVKLSNITHISLAEFIVLSKTPVQRPSAESYITPSESWSEVSWKREAIGELLEAGGKLGITMVTAAKDLGFPSYQKLTGYLVPGAKVDVHTLLHILNTYNLDAGVFFCDSNGAIASQLPTTEEKHVAQILEDKLGRMEKLEASARESERRVVEYRMENARLRKELSAMKRRKAGTVSGTASPVLAEPKVGYRTPGLHCEWAFNRILWQSLPELFEMTKRDFCHRFGFRNDSDFALVDNISADMLVRVCNELRVSVTHFFVRKGEEPAVQDRMYYEISRQLFVPVENHVEDVRYLFGKYSVTGESVENLRSLTGIGYEGFKSMKEGASSVSRVITLADICTQFNISPGVFFRDGNRNKAVYSQSSNERLMLNAIEMMKEIVELRGEVKKLKDKVRELRRNGLED